MGFCWVDVLVVGDNDTFMFLTDLLILVRIFDFPDLWALLEGAMRFFYQNWHLHKVGFDFEQRKRSVFE